MPIHQYTKEARKRIRNAVKRVESMPFAPASDERQVRLRTQQPTLVKAYGDCPRNQIGTFKLVGESWIAPVEITGVTLPALNLGQRIWDGAYCLIQRASLADASKTSDATADSLWVVQQAWSATRIRGVATTAIAPQEIKTINAIVTLDGHYSRQRHPCFCQLIT